MPIDSKLFNVTLFWLSALLATVATSMASSRIIVALATLLLNLALYVLAPGLSRRGGELGLGIFQCLSDLL